MSKFEEFSTKITQAFNKINEIPEQTVYEVDLLDQDLESMDFTTKSLYDFEKKLES